MKSLFVTGASGFLGSVFLAKIKPEEYKSIILLCRSTPTLPENLKNSRNIVVIQAAIHENDRYGDLLNSETDVVHLAAVTGKASREEYFQVNTDGTRILLQTAKNAGVRNILFISSIAVSFEDRAGYYYAESKELAEKLIKESGLKYCIVRPTIILGRDSSIWQSFRKLANSSIILLPGNGRVKIQPIYVDDLVLLLLDIISNDIFNNETLEFGGTEVLSIEDFIQKIHHAITGGDARIIHLPLGIIVGLLRLFEKVFPLLLSVSSAQFTSFKNDSAAMDNHLFDQHKKDMKSTNEILKILLSK